MHFSKIRFKRLSAGHALLAISVSVACTAYAGGNIHTKESDHHGGGATTIMAFETLDADGDRFISYPEAERFPGLEAVFGGLDADRDGRLSAPEYGRFEALDVDKAPKDAPDLPKGEKP